MKQSADTNQQEYVILVHGIGRTKASMRKVEKFLQRRGYRVLNFDYPSTKHSIFDLTTKYLKPFVQASCPDSDRSIHFVTHSMGGLLVRAYLHEHQLNQLGRVVMLAPPNQGSEITDWLKKHPVYQWILGPAGQQLGTDEAGLPAQLGPVNFELGVIAGDRSVNLLNSLRLPGADDGKVTVERAKVPGMTDFLLVHATHTFMMRNATVLQQIEHFLQRGQFRRESDA
jgi:pimeloyl-ACP methyl ester carboxylesterase